MLIGMEEERQVEVQGEMKGMKGRGKETETCNYGMDLNRLREVLFCLLCSFLLFCHYAVTLSLQNGITLTVC